MGPVVSAFGLLLLAVGVIGVFNPKAVIARLQAMTPNVRMGIAVGVRLLMGVLFLLAAGDTRHPTVITVLGWIALVAALLLPLFGTRRLDAMVAWWFERPQGLLRFQFSAALAFAVYLIWAGMP